MKNGIQALKVCGMTQKEQIRQLIDLNVDFIGFIFYERSLRFVLNSLTLADIQSIDHPGKTGVFVNESVEKVMEVAEKAGLTMIQLHGDEDQTYICGLRRLAGHKIKIMKAVRIGLQDVVSKEQHSEEISEQVRAVQNDVDYILFDTDSKGYGGTGKRFDWNLLDNLDIPIPYFLSGGISGDNISGLNTISHKPFAIDINSKFERSPGDKDIEKIKKFKNQIC
ncbi:phosphoribosylanthranilate isomerase [uncultured Chryseobacterium sp.]|uniref:phosphoribosylanthranilate isomerase n=1 Tax=uncultured Chryseobacterium sp. TaxID=259322 RepID=UPI0025CB89F1|nr:phosphoribosylanthranilate isomerase [uncultured Chryseobacterium sp.]